MTSPVLLIRTNAYGELFNTRGAVEAVRSQFGAAEVLALATPQSEGRALLEADARLDGVLLFPGQPGGRKSPAAFRAFMRRRRFGAVVACVGATPGLDYGRHLLSLLLCPGRKYVLDGARGVFPVCSPRGAAAVGRALLSALRLRAGRLLAWGVGHTARALSRRTKRPASGPALAAESVRRILWIRVDGIGDVVMTLPALYALRARFPQARIDLLVRPMSAPLVRGLPGVGQVHTFEPGEAPHSTRSPGRHSLLALAARLRAHRYDLAVDVAGRDIARLLAWCSGARVRVCPEVSLYDDPARGNLSHLMTDPIPVDPDRTRPAVTHFLRLVRRMGAPAPDPPFRLPVSACQWGAVAEKRRALGLTRPFALIHARSAEAAKDWQPARLAAVAEHLRDRHDLDVILTGTERDREYNDSILTGAGRRDRLCNAAGRFGLEELPALCRQARLMVTVDTGPMHIAAMVGTPLVALFLPWFVRRDGPYGQADSALTPFPDLVVPAGNATDFWAGQLLNGISVADVLAAVDRKMRTSEAAPLRAA